MGKKVSRTRALAVLLTTPTIKAAAAECGIAEKTMHAWMREPDFAGALRQAQDEMTRGAMRQVLRAVGRAVDVLEEIMQDTNIAPMPRVLAAKAILEQSIKVYSMEAAEAAPPIIIIDDIGEHG